MHESADPEWTDAGGRCPDSNKENAKTRKRNRKTCGSSNSRKLTKKAGGVVVVVVVDVDVVVVVDVGVVDVVVVEVSCLLGGCRCAAYCMFGSGVP